MNKLRSPVVFFKHHVFPSSNDFRATALGSLQTLLTCWRHERAAKILLMQQSQCQMSNQCYHQHSVLCSTPQVTERKRHSVYILPVLFFKITMSRPLKIETINIIRINGSFQLSVSHIPKFHLQDFLEIRLYKNMQNLKCSVLSKVKADCREFRAMVKY